MSDLTEALRPELWTISSNEALKLFVTEPNGTAINFQPTFTYPIFGDNESIFGFKDLVIFLCFDHYTFMPFLNVKYEKKLNDEVTEPKETMMKYLPLLTVFKDEIKWVDLIKQEKQDYQIPGQKVASFDGQYDIYKLDLNNESGIELQKRLQILVLLFIEAGSYIDYTDDLWDVYVVYDKKNSQDEEPSLVGFCTAYNYWKYPGHEKFDEGIKEVRKKISQFIVLPNYQGKSIGSKFYNELYQLWLNDSSIVEIVVEDPNESFDDLRDKSDLTRIKSLVNLQDINFDKLNSEDGKKWLNEFKASQKLETRQFNRLVEMILLSNYKTFNQLNLRQIRLFIKKRLYEKNKEALLTLEKPVRLDKLQTAYQALEEDYYRILNGLKLYPKRVGEDVNGGSRKKIKT